MGRATCACSRCPARARARTRARLCPWLRRRRPRASGASRLLAAEAPGPASCAAALRAPGAAPSSCRRLLAGRLWLPSAAARAPGCGWPPPRAPDARWKPQQAILQAALLALTACGRASPACGRRPVRTAARAARQPCLAHACGSRPARGLAAAGPRAPSSGFIVDLLYVTLVMF